MTSDHAVPRSRLNPFLKLLLEIGPLVTFFFANSRPELFRPIAEAVLPVSALAGEQANILTATAVFMVAMLVSLIVTFVLTRHLPIMPLVTGVVVLIFGGLTLYFQDALFIKLKPTIVNALFGGALLGGLAFGRSLLPIILDAVFQLDEEGWRKLTFRWGVFFIGLAILNEVVWRTQSDDVWVAFKVWGVMPITLVFALSQTPLILKHQLPEGTDSQEI